MHLATKENTVIIGNIIAKTPIQRVTKESLAEAIKAKTGRTTGTQVIARIIRGNGFSLKQLQINARDNRIKEILIKNKGEIAMPEIKSILVGEGFKFGWAHLRELVRQIREQNNLPAPRLDNKDDIEKYTEYVKEAIHDIENCDLAITTSPKIAYKIMKKHNVLLSLYQVRKIRKLINE